METLRLHGIGIDAVRDIFGAQGEHATRLRGILAERLAPPRQTSGGLLDRIGPLFRRAPRTEVDPRRPLAGDVDALLAGEFIPPERLPQAWQLFSVLLDELAHTSATLSCTDFDAIEFDLARNGLSSEFSLRRLAEREVGVPLRPLPGQVFGYSRHLQAVETRTALYQMQAHPQDQTSLEPATVEVTGPLLRFLDAVADSGEDVDVLAFTVGEFGGQATRA